MGVLTMVRRASRAGVLTMVRRASTVVTMHLPWAGVQKGSSRAGAVIMVRRVGSATAKQWCGRAMQGCRKKVHAVESGFWSGSINIHVLYIYILLFLRYRCIHI